jgi:CBS domain containing-hemolysin-like protein
MPAKGDEVQSDGYIFQIHDVGKTRILKVKITRELHEESQEP